jgi:hypothetical protein
MDFIRGSYIHGDLLVHLSEPLQRCPQPHHRAPKPGDRIAQQSSLLDAWLDPMHPLRSQLKILGIGFDNLSEMVTPLNHGSPQEYQLLN